MITTIHRVNIHHIENNYFPSDENFQDILLIFISALIMLYITSLALIYPITESLYLLTIFIESSSTHLVIINSISFTMNFQILFTVDTITNAPHQTFPWPGRRALWFSYNSPSDLSDVVCLFFSVVHHHPSFLGFSVMCWPYSAVGYSSCGVVKPRPTYVAILVMSLLAGGAFIKIEYHRNSSDSCNEKFEMIKEYLYRDVSWKVGTRSKEKSGLEILQIHAESKL